MGKPEDHRYEDIIHLSRPESGRHPHMSMLNRGAQFSPFAALTGYEAVIQEVSRQTETCTTLADGGVAMLDAVLREIQERIDGQPLVKLIYFQPDDRKEGGSYVEAVGRVKRIDVTGQYIQLNDQQRIPLYYLYRGEILSEETE